MSEPATPASTQTAAATPSSVTTTTTVKPGWKTSEFWLTKAALVLTVLINADVIPVGGSWAKLVASASLVLGSLGYSVVRMNLKTNAVAP